MARAKDMSEREFSAALVRHGIARKNAGDRCESFEVPGWGGFPTHGPFGRQLPESRRAALAELLGFVERVRQDKERFEWVKSLQRGARVATSRGNHRIVIAPWVAGGISEGGGIRLIGADGREARAAVADVHRPTGRWQGPASIRAAHEARRAALVQQLADLDALIAQEPTP